MTTSIEALRLQLARQLDGTHPFVVIETDDERTVREVLFDAVPSSTPYRRWTAVHGLASGRLDAELIPETEHPAAALAWLPIHARRERAITVFYDLCAHLSDPKTLRALREAVLWAEPNFGVVILVERRAELPAALAGDALRVEIPAPTDHELLDLVKETVRDISRNRTIEAQIRRSVLEGIARSLRGLTRRQAIQVVTSAVTQDDRFDDDDLAQVMLHKRNACADLEGVLEFTQAPVSMDEVGGLGRLKAWLANRHLASVDEAEEFGLALPRGVMLLGVQGAGKSLAAKAVATAWKVPLLRLDAGALFDKYIGESERRLRDSLAQADRMAPAVLWIDEIEKGFAGASSHSNDGGLSRRMFGTLLTWMQERRSSTFIVATANDISALPPELLRKGRFDEIFFVDLPDDAVRRTILSIHLKRRKRDPKAFDLDRVVAATKGFSGSELEAGIESALRSAFGDDKRPLRTEDLLEAFGASPPISVVMAPRVAELRAWAAERCVPAD